MSFAVHTEKLNLVSAVASEAEDAMGGTTQSLTLFGTVESHCHELSAVMNLAIPTMTIQLGSVMPGFLTASFIGRNFSEEHLDGFTLASLTVNLFTLSLLQGLYTASDTLSPQAYGAGNTTEVGNLAIRGYVGSLLVVVPATAILMFVMRNVLVYVGEDEESATFAWRWYQVYAVALPFYSLYQVTMKFLSAQNQMAPLVVCSVVASCVVLPFSLWWFGSMFGFLGTAIACVIYQVFLSISLVIFLWSFQSHDPSTWPGLKLGVKQALQWKPFCAYMILGAGGMLASSEWIYWETLSLMIGTFGVVPLSVHTVPTQVIMVTFMAPLSLGIALSIRLGATLPVSVRRAKQTVSDCLLVSLFAFGTLTYAMYVKQDAIIGLFTNSAAVIEGCRNIWLKVCLFNFLLSIFGVLMGISVGLGMQWTLGTTTIVVLWLFGLPAAYYVSVILGGGLDAAWSAVWPPYVIINMILGLVIVRSDWEKIANDIRIREGAELVALKTPTGRSENEPIVGVYGAMQCRRHSASRPLHDVYEL